MKVCRTELLLLALLFPFPGYPEAMPEEEAPDPEGISAVQHHTGASAGIAEEIMQEADPGDKGNYSETAPDVDATSDTGGNSTCREGDTLVDYTAGTTGSRSGFHWIPATSTCMNGSWSRKSGHWERDR